ncbi:hypothetical protein Chy1_0044, partial [Mycobacterium phage Chy1]
ASAASCQRFLMTYRHARWLPVTTIGELVMFGRTARAASRAFFRGNPASLKMWTRYSYASWAND